MSTNRGQSNPADKKAYQSPSMFTQKIELGVFGSYNGYRGGHGGGHGGHGGGHGGHDW